MPLKNQIENFQPQFDPNTISKYVARLVRGA